MLIESVIGNLDDVDQFEVVKVDRLVLDRWEAQKHRLRKVTEGGVEVALSLDRSCRLRDGDILYRDRAGTAIVARVELGEVMVVDLHPTGDRVRTAIEVGLALGNQHWPAVVKGERIYVPVAVDRAAMDSMMRTHAFPGVSYRFTPGEEVVADLTADETRLLFGGAEKEATVGGAEKEATVGGAEKQAAVGGAESPHSHPGEK